MMEVSCATRWFPVLFANGRGELAEGMSLPVRMSDIGAPIQFFSFFDNCRNSIKREEPGNPTVQSIPDLFVYLDIGHGLPSDGTGDGMSLDTLLDQ
jgi:hypothetical protein